MWSHGKDERLRGNRSDMFVRLEHRAYKIDVGLTERLLLRRARTRRHLRGHTTNVFRQLGGVLVRGA